MEGAALGFVWERGPCTAHAVRVAFQRSPSSYWSASAGAIYPLLKRLEAHGLIQAREEARGSRKRRLLTVTRRGTRALRSWLGTGTEASAAAAVFDGVRTRVFFLGALPLGERLGFVRGAARQLARHLKAIEEDLAEARATGDRFRALGALGAWHTARARIAWMKEIEAEIAGSGGENNPLPDK